MYISRIAKAVYRHRANARFIIFRNSRLRRVTSSVNICIFERDKKTEKIPQRSSRYKAIFWILLGFGLHHPKIVIHNAIRVRILCRYLYKKVHGGERGGGKIKNFNNF